MQPRSDEFLEYLAELNDLPEDQLGESQEFEIAIATLYKRLRKKKRRLTGQQRKRADREAVREIAAARDTTSNTHELPTGTPVEFQHKSRTCYCCNRPYRSVHPSYHWLCVPCGNLSADKRTQKADLTGHRALLTGGRIKIGFQTACWLLRSGASVDITTRFPVDATSRFSELKDFDSFKQRLRIYPVDFRNLKLLMDFISVYREQTEALDILIHCAAQSVRRSQTWHERLLNHERNASLTSEQRGLIANFSNSELGHIAESSTSSAPEEFSQLSLLQRDDDDRSDAREKNTWNSDLLETQPVEILEALLVNSNAPAMLTQGLYSLLKNSSNANRFIVNVVGADSMFSLDKSGYHPHVNMSKAALNMMTKSCARRFAADKVFINSVDTGWITHEGGASRRAERQQEGFRPPYDHIDGAARILDPILKVVSGQCEPQWGFLFRNFKPFSW